MAKSEIKMTIKITWWYLWIYIPGLKAIIFLVLLLDFVPELNTKRFTFWTKKAMKFKKK